MSVLNTIHTGGGVTLPRQPGLWNLAARDKVTYRCQGLRHCPPTGQFWDGEGRRRAVGTVCPGGAVQLLAFRCQASWKKGGGTANQGTDPTAAVVTEAVPGAEQPPLHAGSAVPTCSCAHCKWSARQQGLQRPRHQGGWWRQEAATTTNVVGTTLPRGGGGGAVRPELPERVGSAT